MCAAFVASGGSCIETWKLGCRHETQLPPHGRPLFGACVGVAMACDCLWCCGNSLAFTGAFGSARFRVLQMVLNVLKRRLHRSVRMFPLAYAPLHHVHDWLWYYGGAGHQRWWRGYRPGRSEGVALQGGVACGAAIFDVASRQRQCVLRLQRAYPSLNSA